MPEKIAFKEYGKGFPIILLHAFPLDSSMWMSLATFLAAQNWRVIIPDLPGFGDSELRSDTSEMQEMAHAIADLFSKLNIKKAVIGGLSMGGYVALNFVRLFPGKVEALILADTAASTDTEKKKESRFTLIEKLREKDADVLVEEMLPNLTSDFTKTNNPALIEELNLIFKKVNVDGAIAALRGMAERKDHVDFLNKIECPALLIFGEDDKVTDLKAAEVLKNNISNSQLIIIPRSGHLSNLEQPQIFNEAVANFLDNLILNKNE